MNMKLRNALIFGTLVAALGTTAFAEADPDDAIAYRKAVMSSVGGHMKAMAMIMQGKVDQRAAHAAHARGLALSASTALEAFKQNTFEKGFSETTVKGDSIWADWAGYEKRMTALTTAANAMADASEAGTVTIDNLKALGAACKGCHDDFRKKK